MISIQEKRELWLGAKKRSEDFLKQTVLPSIEQNRKGYRKIRVLGRDGKPVVGKRVCIEQTDHDFNFGAHIFMLDGFEREEDNKAYRELFKQYFNLATVPFYFDGLEPKRGHPRFAANSEPIYRRPAPDLCMNYCEENGIRAKVHCLVYDKFIPDWLTTLPLSEAEAVYENRIRQIAERYRGRMMEFEVINETLYSEEWTKQSAVTRKRDVVEWAFALAHKYLPNETLVINEGQPILRASHLGYRSPYFMQIEKCLLEGTPIRKIGLQHHTFTGVHARTEAEYDAALRVGTEMMDPVKIWKGLNVFASLGLPLELTEVTVPTFGDGQEDEEIQAELLELLYTVWFAHPAVNTIVYWNSVDGYCFVNDDPAGFWNENNCRGGLFHHDLTPKKAALTLHKLLHETWHTKLEAVTDETGCIEFRGFFGNYRATADTNSVAFAHHADASPLTELML